MRFLNLCQILISLALSLLLSGCLVGPDFHSPKSPNVKSFTAQPMPTKTVAAPETINAGKAQHFVNGQDISAQWWVAFRSYELDNLVRAGFAHNPTLIMALANLREAEENLNAQVGTSLFPQVNALLSAQRMRQPGSIFGGSQIPAATFNLFTAMINVTYNLDVFGGERRKIEALCAQVDYQRFNVEAAYLTLSSNIVITAIKIASLRAQIEATENLIHLQEETLAIIQKQLQLGGASLGDVLTQENQVAQIKANLPPLLQNLAQNKHTMSILIGEYPSDNLLPEFDLTQLHLPLNLPLTLPSNLVRQRPDIRGAEALWHAASAQVGVATANLFPKINLSAYYGWQSPSIGSLFDHKFSAWSILASLTQPIFNGGALHAKRRAAIAVYKHAGAQYEQTILNAFKNVADTLRALENDARTLRAQRQAEIAAFNAMQLTQKRYHLGGVSYLFLLTNQRQYEQALINRIRAQAARYIDTATLFQALGGGWWNRAFIPVTPENKHLLGKIPHCCEKHLKGLEPDE